MGKCNCRYGEKVVDAGDPGVRGVGDTAAVILRVADHRGGGVLQDAEQVVVARDLADQLTDLPAFGEHQVGHDVERVALFFHADRLQVTTHVVHGRVGESIPVFGAASGIGRYVNSDYPQTRRAESAYPTSAGAPGQPGAKQAFKAEGVDQFGRPFEIRDAEWSATGSEIGPDGVLTAGPDEGNFLVNITCAGKLGSAGLTISNEEVPPPPPEPRTSGTLVWSGEVAPQKWTNLYMKVLTKFVSSGELNLRVSIRAKPQGGVTKQQVEETKAALRGLGLNDNVEAE